MYDYFRFVRSLVVSNLLSLLLLLPLSVWEAFSLAGLTFLGGESFLCEVLGGLTTLVVSSSILNSVVLSIDRYIGIMKPLRYHNKMSKTTIVAALWITWVSSFLLMTLNLLNSVHQEVWNVCDPTTSNHTYSLIVNAFWCILFFVIPFFGKIWIYAHIYNVAELTRDPPSQRSSMISIPMLPSVFPAPSPGPDNVNRRTSIFSTLSKMTLPIGGYTDIKARKISAIVLVGFLLCWSQHFIYYLCRSIGLVLPPFCHNLSMLGVFCFTILSPYVYAFHRERVQKELMSMLKHGKRDRRRCSYYRKYTLHRKKSRHSSRLCKDTKPNGDVSNSENLRLARQLSRSDTLLCCPELSGLTNSISVPNFTQTSTTSMSNELDEIYLQQSQVSLSGPSSLSAMVSPQHASNTSDSSSYQVILNNNRYPPNQYLVIKTNAKRTKSDSILAKRSERRLMETEI